MNSNLTTTYFLTLLFACLLTNISGVNAEKMPDITERQAQTTTKAPEINHTPAPIPDIYYQVIDPHHYINNGVASTDERILADTSDKEQLKKILLSRFAELQKNGFGKIFMFIYKSREALISQTMWTARLSWIKSSGQTDPEISYGDSALNPEPAKNRFALSEAKRRELFIKMGNLQDDADAKASAKYPLPNGDLGTSQEQLHKILDIQSSYREKLEQQEKEKLEKEYGITEEQYNQVGVEGITKGWPTY